MVLLKTIYPKPPDADLDGDRFAVGRC
jgi:hypothetical protein